MTDPDDRPTHRIGRIGRVLSVRSTAPVRLGERTERIVIATVLDPERPLLRKRGTPPPTCPAERLARQYDDVVSENEEKIAAAIELASMHGVEAIRLMLEIA